MKMRRLYLVVLGVLLLLPSAECHATCSLHDEGEAEKTASSEVEPDTELAELAEE